LRAVSMKGAARNFFLEASPPRLDQEVEESTPSVARCPR
jgi:hypothetical protein